jgi:hypothetical protein
MVDRRVLRSVISDPLASVTRNSATTEHAKREEASSYALSDHSLSPSLLIGGARTYLRVPPKSTTQHIEHPSCQLFHRHWNRSKKRQLRHPNSGRRTYSPNLADLVKMVELRRVLVNIAR